MQSLNYISIIYIQGLNVILFHIHNLHKVLNVILRLLYVISQLDHCPAVNEED